MRAREDLNLPRAFVVGGNANTLAFVSSFVPDGGSITAQLVPLAQTPAGVVLGRAWQRAGIALNGLLDWIDSTFAADDETAFVSPMREIELLVRAGWHADPPEQLNEENILNADDLPEEIAQALSLPAETLAQCAACRRLCVAGDFIWKDRPLCAWDYHRQAFGKRGPWHTGTYEDRHFDTLPNAAYIAPLLLEENAVELVLAVANVPEQLAREAVNVVVSGEPARAHMAVRVPDGYSVLRERG